MFSFETKFVGRNIKIGQIVYTAPSRQSVIVHRSGDQKGWSHMQNEAVGIQALYTYAGIDTLEDYLNKYYAKVCNVPLLMELIRGA